MATKKQAVMELTNDHDVLLLREMIASELFQFHCQKSWTFRVRDKLSAASLFQNGGQKQS